MREREGLFYIGNKQATIVINDIMIGDEIFKGTSGLWELLTSKSLDDNKYMLKDYNNYKMLILKTNTIYRDYNPESNYPKSSKSEKWNSLLSPMWYESIRKKIMGKGVVVIPSDPKALLERRDLLLRSKKAGHTGVGNELVSICDKFKRQGVLDSRTYKKIKLCFLKNDSP